MPDHSGPSQRTAEQVVAVVMALFGGAAIAGSLQVGIGWGAEGPKSGFFPFYLGLLIVIGSLVNLFHACSIPVDRTFAAWDQLGRVLTVVVPTAVYVTAVPYIGLYVASFILITGFMIRFGRYSPLFAGGLAAGVIVATFVTFEHWFLVPLPKGPIEDLLGF